MSENRKVALVTGGARGIGFGIASALAVEGCDLAVCGLKPEDDVKEPLGKLRNLGAEVLYCRADVSEGRDRAELIEAVRARFGRLNVLVNNAGVAPSARCSVLEAGEDSFERLIRINLQGPYFLTQLAARWMIEQKGGSSPFEGCIINISSISAEVASVNRGDYCISKAGISMATKLWASALGGYGIPVYEIRPGIISTDMTSGVKEKYDRLIGDGLLIEPRWGSPEDVGRAAAALARGDIPYSTGHVVTIDGGLTVPRL